MPAITPVPSDKIPWVIQDQECAFRRKSGKPTAPRGVAQRSRDSPMTGLVMVLITGAVSLSASVIFSTRNMADVNDEVRAALCG